MPKKPRKPPARADHRIEVGTYDIGYEFVQLLADPTEMGGDFYYQPEKKRLPRMCIGLDHKCWHHVIAVILHEAHEFVMQRLELALEPCGKTSGASDYKVFLMSHAEFGEVCSRVAEFIGAALPDLATHWNKHAIAKGYIQPEKAAKHATVTHKK